MKIGDRVKMKTFNGKVNSDKDIWVKENYWKLVGEIGTVQQDPQENSIYASFSKKHRVLVKFDKDLQIDDLIAHNNISNSLWILVSDLEIIR
jgi:hypothetical protein